MQRLVAHLVCHLGIGGKGNESLQHVGVARNSCVHVVWRIEKRQKGKEKGKGMREKDERGRASHNAAVDTLAVECRENGGKLTGQVQGRLPAAVLGIDVHALFAQQCRAVGVALHGRQVQRAAKVVVEHIGLGLGREQNLGALLDGHGPGKAYLV